jgi:hypothetical protein
MNCSYILYYTDTSPGCQTALKIINSNPFLKKDIYLQNIQSIQKPHWMKGVPILAKVSTKDIWDAGSPSLAQLQYLSETYTKNIQKQPWKSRQADLSLPNHLSQLNIDTPMHDIQPQQAQPQPQIQSPPQNQIPSPPSEEIPQQNGDRPTQPQANTPMNFPPLSTDPLRTGPATFPPLSQPQTSPSKVDPNKVQPIPPPDEKNQEPSKPKLPQITKFVDRSVPIEPNKPTSQTLISQPSVPTTLPQSIQPSHEITEENPKPRQPVKHQTPNVRKNLRSNVVKDSNATTDNHKMSNMTISQPIETDTELDTELETSTFNDQEINLIEQVMSKGSKTRNKRTSSTSTVVIEEIPPQTFTLPTLQPTFTMDDVTSSSS